MKSLIAAASALAAVAVAAPAFSQTPSIPPVTGYVDLGYSYAAYDPNLGASASLSMLDGRLGAKVGKYVGAEGEFGFGINTDNFAGAYDGKLKTTYAGYLVGYLPLAQNAEFFGRVGYGHSNAKIHDLSTSPATEINTGENSWNFGAGFQYFLTANDGFRAEYTRYDFRHDAGQANVFGISYVRRFP
jgi:outer membrane immunogenic protein